MTITIIIKIIFIMTIILFFKVNLAHKESKRWYREEQVAQSERLFPNHIVSIYLSTYLSIIL